MRTILASTLFAATALSVIGVGDARAENSVLGNNFYLEFGVGTSLPPYTDSSIPAIAIPNSDYKPDSTISGGVAFGKYLDNNWRVEGQMTINRAKDGTYAGFVHTGNVTVRTFGVNALRSFDLGYSKFRPFVGAGVGAAVFDFNNLGAVGGAFTVNDSQSTFIGSAIVGVDVPINDKWTATTRYSGAFAGSNTFGTTAPGVTVNMGSTYISNWLVGLRYNF